MTGAVNEGSSIGGPTPTYGGTGAVNTGTPTPWTTISTSGLPYYGSMILSGTTGAKKLQMAFVKSRVDPIEIIRRPAPGHRTYEFQLVSIAPLYSGANSRADLRRSGGTPWWIRRPAKYPLANYTNTGGGPDYTNGVAVGGAANQPILPRERRQLFLTPIRAPTSPIPIGPARRRLITPTAC